MGYKQTDNPFTKLDNSFTNPKVARRKVRQSEALKWNMPDFNSIVEKTADGSTITEDQKTEKTTGTDKEGAVPKAQEGQDGMNADVMHDVKQGEDREKQAAQARSWKDEKKGRKKHERQNRRDIKHYTKGVNRGEVDKDDEGYQEAIARQGYYDTHDTKGKDWHEVEDDFQAGNKKRLKDEADAKENAAKEAEKAKKEEVDKQQANAYGRGKGQAPGMYNNTTNMKQVNSKGSAFPMVAPQPQTNPYGQEEQAPNRAGRSPESNQLSNDPNINQPLNKVPNSTFETNQKFSDMASSAGDPYDQPQQLPNVANNLPAYGQPALKEGDDDKPKGNVLPEFEISYSKSLKDDGWKDKTPRVTASGEKKEFERTKVGGKDNTNFKGTSLEKGEVTLDGKKIKYNKGGMRENLTSQNVIKSGGKITPEIMREAKEGDFGKRAKQQANFAENAFGFKGTAMEKHTKVTKSNVKSAEKDDAAHASYLKRDVKDIQKSDMSQKKKDAYETADEKHISKLYGDLKYDHGHHGRKYDNTNSALSMKMQAPYKQIKYSHSFSDSPMNLEDSDFGTGNLASKKKQERKEYNMKAKAEKAAAKRARKRGTENSGTYGDNAGALYGEF